MYLINILHVTQESTCAFDSIFYSRSRGTEAKVTFILSHEAPKEEQSEYEMTIFPMFIFILPELESLVVVLTSKYDVMTIEQIHMAEPARCIFPTRGICQVFSNVPFQVLVRTFSKKPAVLHEETRNTLATDPS